MGGAAVSLLLSLRQGRPPPLSRRHVSSYAIAGVSGYGVPYLTVGYVSGQGVPAGIVSMLVALSPILTYAGAVALRLEAVWWRVCWASPSVSSASRCWSCPRPACRRGPWCRGSSSPCC